MPGERKVSHEPFNYRNLLLIGLATTGLLFIANTQMADRYYMQAQKPLPQEDISNALPTPQKISHVVSTNKIEELFPPSASGAPHIDLKILPLNLPVPNGACDLYPHEELPQMNYKYPPLTTKNIVVFNMGQSPDDSGKVSISLLSKVSAASDANLAVIPKTSGGIIKAPDGQFDIIQGQSACIRLAWRSINHPMSYISQPIDFDFIAPANR